MPNPEQEQVGGEDEDESADEEDERHAHQRTKDSSLRNGKQKRGQEPGNGERAKRRKVGDDNAAFPGRGISKRSNAPVNFKECAGITHQIEETANKLLMGEEDGDDSERNAPASSFIISELLSRVRTLSEYIIQLQKDRPAATRVSIWQEDGTLAIPPYLDLDPSELEGHSEVHGAFVESTIAVVLVILEEKGDLANFEGGGRRLRVFIGDIKTENTYYNARRRLILHREIEEIWGNHWSAKFGWESEDHGVNLLSKIKTLAVEGQRKNMDVSHCATVAIFHKEERIRTSRTKLSGSKAILSLGDIENAIKTSAK
ncbi:hypothetical protein NliqN6_3469 [Naganishia liquefaciens]|uniref:Uncharacterized protein n=1 Tax=Naganishia liquefaciens TaxID=104408 RepID=A0A8H3TTV1_9TREE|nr:hypothetical protein NliqN6_3469 [Naganishia liquefaciens]